MLVCFVELIKEPSFLQAIFNLVAFGNSWVKSMLIGLVVFCKWSESSLQVCQVVGKLKGVSAVNASFLIPFVVCVRSLRIWWLVTQGCSKFFLIILFCFLFKLLSHTVQWLDECQIHMSNIHVSVFLTIHELSVIPIQGGWILEMLLTPPRKNN